MKNILLVLLFWAFTLFAQMAFGIACRTLLDAVATDQETDSGAIESILKIQNRSTEELKETVDSFNEARLKLSRSVLELRLSYEDKILRRILPSKRYVRLKLQGWGILPQDTNLQLIVNAVANGGYDEEMPNANIVYLDFADDNYFKILLTYDFELAKREKKIERYSWPEVELSYLTIKRMRLQTKYDYAQRLPFLIAGGEPYHPTSWVFIAGKEVRAWSDVNSKQNVVNEKTLGALENSLALVDQQISFLRKRFPDLKKDADLTIGTPHFLDIRYWGEPEYFISLRDFTQYGFMHPEEKGRAKE